MSGSPPHDEDPRTSTAWASARERRLATILFADLTGFTSLVEAGDPEAVYDFVNRCLAAMERIVRAGGGRVEKVLGDGVMAVFGVPAALENAPYRAVTAALRIRSAVRSLGVEEAPGGSVDVHSGIDSGPVIAGDASTSEVRDFAVLGDAVNIASRLKDLARAGEILVGDSVRRATEGAYEYAARPPVRLRGKREPVRCHLLRSRDPRPLPERTSLAAERFRAPFVGRDAELARADAALGALARGRGGLLAVVGEAGIGKSRLLRAFRERSPERVRWIHAPSRARAELERYHPFVALIREARGGSGSHPAGGLGGLALDLPDAAETAPVLARIAGLESPAAGEAGAPGAEGSAAQVRRALAGLLRTLARDRPAAVVFEDFHRADPASVDLLADLLPLLRDTALLFVLSCRPGFPDTSERLLAAARDRLGDGARVLHLAPLSRPEARRLVDLTPVGRELDPAVRSALLDRARGNPLFLEEALRVVEPHAGRPGRREGTRVEPPAVRIPDTVQEILASRIDRLPAASRRVLQVAAVAGFALRPEVLARVLEEDGEEAGAALEVHLERLREEGLLARSEGDGLLEIAHPLIREVACELLLRREREALHRRVARAWRACVPESTPGYHGTLAYHALQGRDREAAEALLLRAGDEAASVGAPRAALIAFRQAAHLYLERHGDEVDPAELASLERRIGEALFYAGDLDEAAERFGRALELLGFREPRSPRRRALSAAATVLGVLPALYLRRGGPGQRPPTAKDRELIALLWRRAQSRVTGEPGEFVLDSLATLRRLARVDPRGVDDAAGMLAASAGLFSWSGISFGIGDRFLARAGEILSPFDERGAFRVAMMRFTHRFLLGDWGDEHLIPWSRVRRALALGELWDATNYLALAALRHAAQGRFAEAEEVISRLEGVDADYDYDLARSSRLAGVMALEVERGRLDLALAAAREHYANHAPPALNLLALGAEARIHLLRGHPEEARDCLERGEAVRARAGSVLPLHLSRHLASALLLAADERGRPALPGWSRRRLRRAALRTAARVAWTRPEVLRAAAREALGQGHVREAARLFDSALEAARSLGARPEQARILVDLADAIEAVPRLATRVQPAEPGACRAEAEAIHRALAASAPLPAAAPSGAGGAPP